MNTDKEITLNDVLKARIQTALDLLVINDLQGCQYSLLKAVKLIDDALTKLPKG